MELYVSKILPEITQIETGSNPRYSVIWLHGLGADSSDFEELPTLLKIPEHIAVRFILPNAPHRRISINEGMKMRGWYDLIDINNLDKEYADGLNESIEIVNEIVISEVKKGVDRSAIIVGGFSQGGAVALSYGVRCDDSIGGIVGLSTYLPLGDYSVQSFEKNSTKTPIFIAHGEYDPILNLKLSMASRDLLRKNSYKVSWSSYKMAHTICIDEMQDLSNWLNANIWID